MIWNPENPSIKTRSEAYGVDVGYYYLETDREETSWLITLNNIKDVPDKNWYLGPRELGEWNDL